MDICRLELGNLVNFLKKGRIAFMWSELSLNILVIWVIWQLIFCPKKTKSILICLFFHVERKKKEYEWSTGLFWYGKGFIIPHQSCFERQYFFFSHLVKNVSRSLCGFCILYTSTNPIFPQAIFILHFYLWHTASFPILQLIKLWQLHWFIARRVMIGDRKQNLPQINTWNL